MPTSTPARYGLAIRLPSEDRGLHAMPDARATAITEKIVNSFAITISKIASESSSYLIKYHMRLRIEPARLLIDLLGELTDQNTAMDWMGNSRNGIKMRANEEKAIHLALDRWCRQEYAKVVHCDQNNVWLSDENDKLV